LPGRLQHRYDVKVQGKGSCQLELLLVDLSLDISSVTSWLGFPIRESSKNVKHCMDSFKQSLNKDFPSVKQYNYLNSVLPTIMLNFIISFLLMGLN